MRGARRYPTEPAGPFPRPPASFADAEDRRLRVEALDDDEAALEALTRMYVRFHPADRAQGIPPTGEETIRRWLEPLVERGVNVAVRPADDGEEAAASSPETDDAEDDRPNYVGHAVLVPDTDDPDPRADPADYEWELAIFVLQAYQRAGVGTELLEHLLGEAAARGIERVWLTVERWNGPAIALYERVGFETVGSESFDREMAIRLEGED
ncbi:GNAT family N-acetyltransferase [Halovivax sp.]|uniref:GNAT family N-acetyltransferase n=1 Tax=Halovivax sp. TaxID=1935978 RepID=UPI0025C5572B|nr:GNAT family N-acetyltransferase [Halovivax sp.]